MMIPLTDVSGVITGGGLAPAGVVRGWSVDTRTIGEGELYFALRGPNHDGHRFVPQAFAKGAAAAVVEQPVKTDGLLLPVEDSYQALQRLAGWARREWKGTVVAITGSAGKTTTKDIIARFLSVRKRVGMTAGNLNNHVGLPLSILRLPDDAEMAVLEIGMNHAGEIRRLCSVAAPDVGVVTNVGYAHVENFDSLDEVAAAKGELIEALPADGTAVLNADDERVARLGESRDGPVVTFGFSNGAGIRALAIERMANGTRFEVAGAGWFETQLEGRHAVENILAAMAVARVFDIEPGDLREELRKIEPAPMRGRRFTWAGITVLDDCYNSNPNAARAMLRTLRETPGRRRIAVLGEMLELGRWTDRLHEEIGREVVACGIDVLVGIRGATRLTADAAVAAGLPASAAYIFPEPEPAGDLLKKIAREGDVVLFKGSRGSHVERALEIFLRDPGRDAVEDEPRLQEEEAN